MDRRYRLYSGRRPIATDITAALPPYVPPSILRGMHEAPEPSQPLETLSPFVTAIDHVGIAVADLDAAIAFHTKTFGLEVTHVEENEEQGVREAMLRAPGDTAGAAVQLLAPATPESTIAKFLDRNGPGLQQLAYRVTDVEAAAAALRSAGLRVLYPTARRGTANSKVNFVHPKDAGGVLVELVEPAADSADDH
jgi:methylmalonyl-CoA/ethylmalonyl-CoA epimerase